MRLEREDFAKIRTKEINFKNAIQNIEKKKLRITIPWRSSCFEWRQIYDR